MSIKKLLNGICIIAAIAMSAAEPVSAMYECTKTDYITRCDSLDRDDDGLIYIKYVTNIPPGDWSRIGPYIYCDGSLEVYKTENLRHKAIAENYQSYVTNHKLSWDGERISTPDGAVFPFDSKGHTLAMLENGYIAEKDYTRGWRVMSIDGEYVLPDLYLQVIGLDWDSFLISNDSMSYSLIKLDHWIGVINTDIRTYINGYEIPCWVVDGYIVVTAEDLGGYGFDVNLGTHSLNIKRNSEYYNVNPVQCAPKQETGTLFSQIYPTDMTVSYDGEYDENGIVRYSSDKKIKSYAIDGYMLIRPEDLVGDGISCVYNNESRRLDITVESLASNY